MHDTRVYYINCIVSACVCCSVQQVRHSQWIFYRVTCMHGNRWKNAAGGRVRVLSPETKSRSEAVACKFELGNGTATRR